MLYSQVLSQDMLKKYITYAKLNVFPKIHDADLDKISHVYAELRRESSVWYPSFLALSRVLCELNFWSDTFENKDVLSSFHVTLQHGQGVPIAVRHIESIINLWGATCLRKMLTWPSFISTKKFSVQKALQKVNFVGIELLYGPCIIQCYTSTCIR